jgi:hypothetical protein
MTFLLASQFYLNPKALHASRSFEAGSNGAMQRTIATDMMSDPKGYHQLD